MHTADSRAVAAAIGREASGEWRAQRRLLLLLLLDEVELDLRGVEVAADNTVGRRLLARLARLVLEAGVGAVDDAVLRYEHEAATQ